MYNLKLIKQEKRSQLIAVSRSGELAVLDKQGRERERYKVPYGAILTVEDSSEVKAGQVVATWDPHAHPVITEAKGRAKLDRKSVV